MAILDGADGRQDGRVADNMLLINCGPRQWMSMDHKSHIRASEEVYKLTPEPDPTRASSGQLPINAFTPDRRQGGAAAETLELHTDRHRSHDTA